MNKYLVARYKKAYHKFLCKQVVCTNSGIHTNTVINTHKNR